MKQTIKHGAVIDALTPEEMRQMLSGREAGHSGIFDVVAGDFNGPEPVLMTNPPYRRLRITRHGRGAEAFAVAASPVVTPVLDPIEGRLGGQIVNSGAVPVFIYLAGIDDLQGSERASAPTLWLSANGGAWDFEISSLIWGGSVCAAGIGGATTLTYVEL